MKTNRGSILILTFWALIILSIMGFGISRRANAQLSLVRYQMGKARGKYAAFAGLFYVIDQLRQDLKDPDSSKVDMLSNCGVALEPGQESEQIFKQRNVGDAVFDVVRDGDDERHFGLSDETAKINLNAITERNAGVLKALLRTLGVGEKDAEIIACSVVDWTDRNNVVFEKGSGAEQDFYQTLDPPYACKNSPFESVEELLLVRGMTKEIFDKVRPFVTIYPYRGSLKVNFNTADETVLRALALSVTGARTGTNDIDAQRVVQDVVEYRDGSDGEWGTADDEPVVLGKMSFTGPELAIASAVLPMQTTCAAFVRAHVEATDTASDVMTVLDAVIETKGFKVVALAVK